MRDFQIVAGIVLIAGLALCLVVLAISRGVDDLFALRRWRRERLVRPDGAFPVLTRSPLSHEPDGPGVYVVSGVLARNGAPTQCEVQARDVNDAVRQALGRGISPADVTRQR